MSDDNTPEEFLDPEEAPPETGSSEVDGSTPSESELSEEPQTTNDSDDLSSFTDSTPGEANANEGATATELVEESTDTQESVDKVQEVSGITLLEGEEILRDVRPAWVNWSGSIILGVLTIWFGLGVVFFIYAWLARRNSHYVVTNQRIVHKKGLLSTNTKEYRIRDIRQLQTGQNFTEKLNGVGNITINTGGGSTITFDGVPNYNDVANTIREQQRKLE